MMQTQWASQINPILANPLNLGSLITGIQLKSGVNVINHGLGRPQQGWIIADQTAAASIYRSAPFNNLTLNLTSSAPVTISLMVF